MGILTQYVSELAGISCEEVPAEIRRIKEKWNTDLFVPALMGEYGVHFKDLVHKTYARTVWENRHLLKPDHERLVVLNKLGAPKIVFTNSPRYFGIRVLAYVGLVTCFFDVIGIEEVGFVGKTNPLAFQNFEGRYPTTWKFILCDNSLPNLDSAKTRGWKTVWFKKQGDEDVATDHRMVTSFKELENLF